MLSVLVPLIMQVGIAPTTSPVSAGAARAARPPDAQRGDARSAGESARDRRVPRDRAQRPGKARALAEEWVSRTTGLQRAAGRHCLGVAASNARRWSAAATRLPRRARRSGRRALSRARMSALAGSALLAEDKPAEALAALDAASAMPPAMPRWPARSRSTARARWSRSAATTKPPPRWPRRAPRVPDDAAGLAAVGHAGAPHGRPRGCAGADRAGRRARPARSRDRARSRGDRGARRARRGGAGSRSNR